MEEVDAMETSSYLDVSSATAGHTSAEGVSLDQSELNVLADDLMDTSIRASTGNSLRSSRRRVQKHSAVVLNADRLKKVIHHQSNPDDPTIADTTMLDESNLGEDISMVMQSVQSSAEEITIIPSSSTQPPGKDSSPNIKTNTTNHDSANPRTPPTTHQVGIRIWTEDKAQRHIIRWYRRQVAARLRRFTLHGKWSVTTSMKVFTLLLGYRIRRLFHSNEMKKMKLAQDDMQRVLLDLMRSSSTSPSTPRDDRSPFWLPHIRTEIIANKHLSPTDQNLAKSLVRELLAEREKFVKYVFHFATWISFPLPGYWNISGTRLKRTSSLYFSSPRTTNTTNHNKLITETPPHVKMAMSKNDSNNMKKVPVRLNLGRNPNPIIDPLADFSEIISSEGTSLLNDDQLKPKPLGDVMQDKSKIMSTPVAASQNFGEYVDDRPITPSAAYISPGGVNISSVSAAAAYKRVDISTSLSNKIKGHSQSVTSAPTSIVSDANLSKKLAQHSSKRESTSPEWKQPQSTRNRNEDGGHIQLDILSAEKLIPAKKGAVANKEGPGGPVPDRKPCLKVTMNLPTVNHPRASPPPLGPPGSSLKKAYQGVRDFEEITLTPMWDTTFNISLPIPKTMLKTIVDKYNFMEQHDIELTESEYQAICRTVLDWWSDGNIVVEVFDGERFNEDIFMGQVVILISSFLPLIKKHHELEIKGGFILEKTKPSQRVSGTIKLHAYLHVPEKKYIEDLLQSFVSSSRKQMMKHIGASREQNSHGHHRLSRVNSQKAVIVTDSEEEEVIPPKPTVTATSSSSKAKSQASKNTPVSSNRKSPASAPPSSASSNPAKVNLASKKRLEDTHEMLRKIDSLIHGFDQDESDYLDHDDDELEPDDFHAAHNPVDEDDLVDTKAQYVSKFMQSLSLEQKDLAAEKVNNSYINSSSMQYEDDDSLPVMNLEESENINIAYHRSKIPPPPPPPPATAVKSQPNPSLPTSNHKPATPTSLAKESKLPRPTTYSLLKQMKVQQSPGQDSPLAQQPYRNITVSSIVSEESARESSQVKRNFLSDMSKQLDNLSAIQQSADVVYDNLSKKLEEQRRAKAATTSPDSYDSSSSPAPPVQRLTPSTSNSKIPVMTSLRNKYPSGSTPKAMSTSSASSPRGSFSFNDTLSTMSSEDDRVVEKKVSPRPPQSQSASKSNYRTNHDSESDGRDLRRTVDRLEDNDTPVFGESEASLGSDYEDLLKEMEDPTYDDEDYRSLAGSNYDQQFDIDADYADEYTNKFTRNYHRDQEEESADDEVILIPSPQKQEQQRAPVISASAKARIQQRQADKYRDFNFSSQEEDEVPSKSAHVRPVSRGKITVPSYSSGKRIGHSEVEKTTNRRDYGYGSGSGVEDVEELYDSNEDILSSSATNKSNQVGKLAVNSSTSAKASGSGSKSRVVHKSTLDLEGYDML